MMTSRIHFPKIWYVPRNILHNNCAAYRCFKILHVPKLRPYKIYFDEIPLHCETDILQFVTFMLIYQWENINANYATMTSSRSYWTESSNPYTVSDVTSIDEDGVIKTNVEIIEE